MLSKLMDAMFGCRHARYSFPITVRAGSRRTSGVSARALTSPAWTAARNSATTGSEMKIVGSQAREVAHSLVTKEAA